MIKKSLKVVATAIVCLTLVALASALLYRRHLQHQVAVRRAITSPDGIDSLEAVRIGGIDQWIEVRGQNVDNPILLFLHGGPGIAFIPLASAFQDPWESHFTVVEWDQRGAGKTYSSNDRALQRRTMTIPRMQKDTLDLVNYLRARFHRRKIIVVGDSWGSVLGLWLAHEHPDLLYAYVGVGQVVNMRQNAVLQYQAALQQARNRNNQPAIQELQGLAPYPPPVADMHKMFVVNKWAGKLLGPPQKPDSFTDVRRILTSLISAPEYSLADDIGFVRGQMFSGEVLFPELSLVDLSRLGPNFDVPVFFFEGRQDPYCQPSLIQQYSQTIKAPHMELVWFDQSGHFPYYEEPQKFNIELVQRVLPFAQ